MPAMLGACGIIGDSELEESDILGVLPFVPLHPPPLPPAAAPPSPTPDGVDDFVPRDDTEVGELSDDMGDPPLAHEPLYAADGVDELEAVLDACAVGVMSELSFATELEAALGHHAPFVPDVTPEVAPAPDEPSPSAPAAVPDGVCTVYRLAPSGTSQPAPRLSGCRRSRPSLPHIFSIGFRQRKSFSASLTDPFAINSYNKNSVCRFRPLRRVVLLFN